jgi:hypothetical protein
MSAVCCLLSAFCFLLSAVCCLLSAVSDVLISGGGGGVCLHLGGMDGGGDTLREEKGVSGGKCAKVKRSLTLREKKGASGGNLWEMCKS